MTTPAWQRQYEEQSRIAPTGSSAALVKVSRWNVCQSRGLNLRLWSSRVILKHFRLLQATFSPPECRLCCSNKQHVFLHWGHSCVGWLCCKLLSGCRSNKEFLTAEVLNRSPVPYVSRVVPASFYTMQCAAAIPEWRIVCLLKQNRRK